MEHDINRYRNPVKSQVISQVRVDLGVFRGVTNRVIASLNHG